MTPDVIGVTIVVIVVLLVLLALVLVFRASWRVAEPDEALIISGLRASGRQDGAGESMGFNIVTGRGALILPGVHTAGPGPLHAGDGILPPGHR